MLKLDIIFRVATKSCTQEKPVTKIQCYLSLEKAGIWEVLKIWNFKNKSLKSSKPP